MDSITIGDGTAFTVVYNNALHEIDSQKRAIYKKTFPNAASEEDIIQMRAYEYAQEIITKVMGEYLTGTK